MQQAQILSLGVTEVLSFTHAAEASMKNLQESRWADLLSKMTYQSTARKAGRPVFVSIYTF
jgi:hypothetical protein